LERCGSIPWNTEDLLEPRHILPKLIYLITYIPPTPTPSSLIHPLPSFSILHIRPSEKKKKKTFLPHFIALIIIIAGVLDRRLRRVRARVKVRVRLRVGG
jgi:hypothetical protein